MNEFLVPREIPGATVEHDTTLSELTTLRVGGRPRALVRCQTQEAITEVVSLLDDAAVPTLILGGGSNLVIAEGEVDVVVVKLENSGIEFFDGGLVRVQAGMVWDDVVAACVDKGLGGIECLSGIPGSAGATPVQNVGAYGVEISDVLTRVKLYDRRSGETSWVQASELDLAYRYSNLKFTQRAVVLEMEMQLRDDALSAPLRFGQLAGAPGDRRPAAEVRAEVLALRSSKGMVSDPDDPDTWSAGSFFTNPIVDAAVADRVYEKVGEERMPRWDVDAGVKLSAAWLIERAGFPRGFPGEDAAARLSTKHTLALTNRGSATTDDIVQLARTVRDGVSAKFGITLEPEPVWIGVSI
ncbi:UDP-N-acetylmuramate dehydrogenase [Corynebacterium tapiri]|uniref:UDP-N-acetylenolpyruvoylglucosamine reductase n=1 Tax=Corynebacterium tapiri TaxID=1448266 RepID=A0A5C4U2Z9_9CORY|nr:UDP-N-acetylmuramate dehydrogenase [Corynebacterium tapiri]TNL97318.1 UDP-N-acetylmuramate dehydrogenase [Corynebacterium tapiri]